MKLSPLANAIESVSAALEQAGVVYGHGTDSAWDEATALVLGVTGLPDQTASLSAPITSDQQQRIRELLQQRTHLRIPLPYLLGRAHFAALEFEITPGVVIPRSPIGQLIQQHFEPWLKLPPARIIDLCCGSGCIGIAAAIQFPGSELTLVDIDPAAIALSQRNLARHGLTQRAQVLQADLWEGVPPGGFDLILCNPPYVDATDMRTLPPEYQHEPILGLAGGDDGLDLVHRLLAALPERLSPQGLLVCEVGASAPALLQAYPHMPFVWPDLLQGGEGVFLFAPALA